MVNELREVERKGRFSIFVGDKVVEMRITRVLSRSLAKWVGCFTAKDKSVDFKEVTVIDNKESVEFPWKFRGTYRLSHATQDSISFHLTMREIQKLKEGFEGSYKRKSIRKANKLEGEFKMKKGQEERKVYSPIITSFKQSYLVDTLKNTYGRGMAVIIEGEIVMNILVWNKGSYISPQDKSKVTIEWLKDLIKVLEED